MDTAEERVTVWWTGAVGVREAARPDPLHLLGAQPGHLAIPVKAKSEDEDVEAEPNRALAALEDAAKAMGRRISDAANVAGTGVATAAGAVTRPFRSVDLDGDGIPDAPQALTAVKGVGGAIADAAGSVGGAAASLFKTKKRGRHSAGAAQRRTEDTSAGVEE